MITALTERKEAISCQDLSRAPLVAIVDDDQSVREALERLIKFVGTRKVSLSAEDVNTLNSLSQTRCLILDVHVPGMSKVEHLARLLLLTLTPPHDRKH